MSNLSAEPRTQPASIFSKLTLVDFTDLPRVGFRGADTAIWLASLGLDLPQQPNKAVVQQDGSLVARLSQTEYLWLAGTADHGARVAREEAQWQQSKVANYLLPRQDSHAWLQLSGDYTDKVMAKLCGVDLRPATFLAGNIVQTSVARVSCIIINASRNEKPCLHLLFDRPSLAYFQEALEDAMEEFYKIH